MEQRESERRVLMGRYMGKVAGAAWEKIFCLKISTIKAQENGEESNANRSKRRRTYNIITKGLLL